MKQKKLSKFLTILLTIVFLTVWVFSVVSNADITPTRINLTDAKTQELNDFFKLFLGDNSTLGDYDVEDAQSSQTALSFVLWLSFYGVMLEDIGYPDAGFENVSAGEIWNSEDDMYVQFISANYIESQVFRFFGITDVPHQSLYEYYFGNQFEYRNGRYYSFPANGSFGENIPNVVDYYDNGNGTFSARIQIRYYAEGEFSRQYHNIAVIQPFEDTYQLLYWRNDVERNAPIPIRHSRGTDVSGTTSATINVISIGIKITLPQPGHPHGYNIYRSRNSNERGERINSRPIIGGEFVDVNVGSSETYFYTVYEADEHGQSVNRVEIEQNEVTTGNIPDMPGGRRGFIILTIGKDTMLVGENIVEIDPGRGTAPIIEGGRTLLPIRAVVEAMSGTVDWEANENRISMVALGNSLDMWIGRTDMRVNGSSASMDIAPMIINGRTMLPVRFVAENIGALIEWIGATQEVIIVFPI